MDCIFGINRLLEENEIQNFSDFVRLKYKKEIFFDNNTLFFKGRTRNNLNHQVGIKRETATNETILCSGRIFEHKINESLLVNKLLSDEDLLILAFRNWEEDFLHHVKGNFNLAHFTPENLTIFNDHHGVSSMYYYFDGTFFAFSSSLNVLLKLPGVMKVPDKEKLAQYVYGVQPGADSTFFKDIRRLPTGRFIQFNLQSKKIDIHTYWKLEKEFKRWKNQELLFKTFRKEFENAVEQRAKRYENIATTLSSGFDSSAVTAVLSNTFRNKQITAITAVPGFALNKELYKGRLLDESEIAKSIPEQYAHINYKKIDSKDTNLVASLEKVIDVFGQPVTALANCYWIFDILKHCNKQKVECLFTGQDGNGTISFPWTVPQNIRKIKNIIKKQITNRKNAGLSQIRENIDKTALISEFKVNKKFIKDLKSIIKLRKIPIKIKDIQLNTILPGVNYSGNLWFEAGFYYNVDVCDPTKDKDLASFCYQISPKTIFFINQKRFLVKNSLKGVIPEIILNNSKRGQQSADIVQRILNEEKKIQKLFEEFVKNEEFTSIIETKSMEKAFKLLKGVQRKGEADQQIRNILRGLIVGMFLSKY